MPFDKTEPQDTTKLRRLGEVIRPNWEAIEEGQDSFKPYAINHVSRNDIAPEPVDPAAIAGACITYSKDVSGIAQLFAMRENSSSVQITGPPTVASAHGSVFLPGGIIMKWGQVSTGPGGVTMYFGGAPAPDPAYNPFPTTVWSIVGSSFQSIGSSDVTFSNIGVGGAKVYSVKSNTVYYIAIGN